MSGLRAMTITSKELGVKLFIPMKNGPGGGFSGCAKKMLRDKAISWHSYQTGSMLRDGQEIFLINGDTLTIGYTWQNEEQQARTSYDKKTVLAMLAQLIK